MIASTNRPFDLDEAVLRRLPRRILVDLPDLQTRQEILSVTLANNRVSSSVNFTQLAEKLEGYTGSDIKEVCREAVVRVAHERAKQLENGLENVAGIMCVCFGVLCIVLGVLDFVFVLVLLVTVVLECILYGVIVRNLPSTTFPHICSHVSISFGGILCVCISYLSLF